MGRREPCEPYLVAFHGYAVKRISSYSVDMNFLITTIPVSTVAEPNNKANQVVRAMKKWGDLRFKIHAFPKSEDLE